MAPAPKNEHAFGAGASDREKRARAEAARRALGQESEQGVLLVPGEANFYELLGVEPWCSPEELQAAFKRRALQEHPDKGGDQERFDELKHAYNILADEDRRDDYDRALQRAEDKEKLVEGRPEPKAPKAEKAPVVKTAPRVGSKRAKDWLRCSAEHNADRSGAALVTSIRLAILDAESTGTAAAAAAPLGAVPQGAAAAPAEASAMAQKTQKETEREQTEALFEKYRGLNDGMKKQWVNTLTGKQKQALKMRAKEEETKQMDKAKKWLGKK